MSYKASIHFSIYIFYFIVSTVAVQPVFSQDTLMQKNTVAKKNRLSLGVNLSPDICNRTLKSRDGNPFLVSLRNKYEVSKWGYTLGINGCYILRKHINIDAGLQYSNKGYTAKSSDLTFGDLIDPRYGYVCDLGASVFARPNEKIIFNYIYLDVPVRIVYILGKKRLQFTTSLGVTTNILLRATETSISTDSSGNKKQNTEKQAYKGKVATLTPTISAGINYQINSKTNMSIEPVFRYSLFDASSASVKTYLWSYGLMIGYYYKLQ